jgi:O-antigen/teichoic acid export membrane protein
MGYMGWFAGSFAGSLIMFLLYFYPLYFRLGLWPILRFRPRFITPHLKVALPMVPHNYSTYLLNSSDRVVMDLYKVSERQIGLYNVAYTFGNYFEAVGEAVGMAVGPFFSKLFSTKGEKAQKDERLLTFFLMGCFLSATFVASLWLREIFNLLISNPDLRTEYPIGILIIMGYAYRPMYWSAGIKLSVAKKTSLLWRISLVAGLVNVGLNLVFVPFYGIYAAAISTLISLLYIGFSGFFLKPYREMPGIDHFPLRWMAAILALTGIVYLLRDAPIPAKVMVTGALFVFGAVLFRRHQNALVKMEV